VPEGHAVHRMAAMLHRSFAGRPVAASSPQGRFASGADLIDGRVLDRADAWGKHLFVDVGDLVLHVHLGLYGTWVRADAPGPEPRGAVRLRLENDRWYADLRGPTACNLLDDAGREAILARLGPDPLRRDADVERFLTRVTTSRTPIGVLLMDQSVIAGVGNIYRAEVLFRHHLSPRTEGRAVPPDTVRAVWDDLRVLMRDGVRRGRIVTVEAAEVAALAAIDVDRPSSDDATLDGGDDTLQRRRLRRSTGSYVYGREGRACVRCGSPVRAADVAGRRLYWCERCQPPVPTVRVSGSPRRRG